MPKRRCKRSSGLSTVAALPSGHRGCLGLPALAVLAVLAVLASLAGLPACGIGALQTARPTAVGQVDLTGGLGYLHNSLTEERGIGLTSFPLTLGARTGVAERADVGLRLFSFGGALADAKLNLMPPAHPLAVSLSLGFGGAADVFGDQGAWYLHLPVNLLVSYDVRSWFTPYASLGYGFFWIFGRENPSEDPSAKPPTRKGHGDGVVMVSAGMRFRVGRRTALFAEYSFWGKAVDDPGDYYSFVHNHFALAGLQVTLGRLQGP